MYVRSKWNQKHCFLFFITQTRLVALILNVFPSKRFLPAPPYIAVCSDHFRPILRLCNKFEILNHHLDKLRHYIVPQRISKFGQKIALFTDLHSSLLDGGSRAASILWLHHTRNKRQSKKEQMQLSYPQMYLSYSELGQTSKINLLKKQLAASSSILDI